ncbi:hypothetical protein [Klebsiella aerogenes]|uniref:hypothetical protein n=1 Tax=Klebsiella aerogenes TaxID=548 RepID=UPI003694EF95
MMDKRETEVHVLELSRPLLHKIYGGYSIDKSQIDRPDAAIYVKKPHRAFCKSRVPFRVGIEITTCDKCGDLGYLKDDKFGKDKVDNQINDFIHGIDSKTPNKKVDVKIPVDYIYEGVVRKNSKFNDYVCAGVFKEVVLICFSEVIGTDNVIFKNGLRQWSEYLISKSNSMFDKVIFVDLLGGRPVCIYDKQNPHLIQPLPYAYENSSITVMQSPMLRFEQQNNLNEIYANEPLIAKRIAKPRSKK